jgi:hypothetical protein
VPLAAQSGLARLHIAVRFEPSSASLTYFKVPPCAVFLSANSSSKTERPSLSEDYIKMEIGPPPRAWVQRESGPT